MNFSREDLDAFNEEKIRLANEISEIYYYPNKSLCPMYVSLTE